MRKPKTEGVEWLGLSLASFNGSGYADRQDKETFVDSYIAYKLWKKLPEAADLARHNYDFSLEIADNILQGREPGHAPSKKNLRQFSKQYAPAKSWI